MIVYGVKEHVSEVDPSVYDTAFVIENGKMTMQTDIDMNGHRINVPHFITGYYNNSKHENRVFLNGVNPFQVIPFKCRLTEIFCYFYGTQKTDFQITLKVKSIGQNNQTQLFNSLQNKTQQNFDMNVQLTKNDILGIEIYKQGATEKIVPNGAVFSAVFLIG